MTNRRNSYKNRCTKCLVTKDYCCCNQISAHKIKTRIDVIMHKLELYQTSNSAKLTFNSLPENVYIHYRGLKENPINMNFINHSEYSPIYLFPYEDASVLDQSFLNNLSKPIQLIVPDGRWSQAKKIYRREKELADIPCFKLPPLGQSQYELRRQNHEHRVCTHEAISYALGIIENKAIESALLKNLEAFVSAHTRSRTCPLE
jgi:hypothetical protein